MNLKQTTCIFGMGVFATTALNAATVTITALDLRSTGVFGHSDAVAGTINATGNPVDFTITYNNLDLDGDATANDSVMFTVAYTSSNTQRLMNQGADTGFGSANDLTVSVANVSGTTTDSGHTIVFDGFTGATGAAGRTGAIDSSVDINGTTVFFSAADTGSFTFLQQSVDFAATPTVLFDNTVNNEGGTVVARNFDLQFSSAPPVPEPSSAILVGLAGGMFAFRRRK